MDTAQIYNLIRRVLIKTMKRTKRESGKLHVSTHPSTLMWPQMFAKTFLTLIDKHFPPPPPPPKKKKKKKKAKQNLQ